MTLSTAARLGAMLKPQAFNSFDEGGSCFLRAAADACGIQDIHIGIGTMLNYGRLQLSFPVLLEMTAHPVYGWRGTVWGVICSLNDGCRWSRERIADWLEGVEHAHEPQAEPVEVVS